MTEVTAPRPATRRKQFGIRLSDEAAGLFEALQAHFGLRQTSLLEYLVRDVARRESVTVAAERGDVPKAAMPPPPKQREPLPVLSTDVTDDEIEEMESERSAGMVAVTRKEQARSI